MTASVITVFRSINGAGTTHSVAMTGLQAGDTVKVDFLDRTGGAVITNCDDNDSVNDYTQRSYATAGTVVSAVNDRPNITAPPSGNLTVSYTTSNTVSSQVTASIIRSNLGGGAFAAMAAVATPNTPAANVNATSNTLTAPGAGLLIGFIGASNSQATTPTIGDHADLTGETVDPAAAAGTRTFVPYANSAAGGTRSFTGNATVVLPSISGWAFHALYYSDTDVAPSITNLNGGTTVVLSDQANTITGENFDPAAEAEIRFGGLVFPLDITSQDATSITYNMEIVVSDGSTYAPGTGAAVIAVINPDLLEGTLNITILPDATTAHFTVGTPNANPALRLTATPEDYEASDQTRISDVVGTGDISDVSVNSDLTWDATAPEVENFKHQVWNHDNGFYTAAATQFTASDPSSGNHYVRRPFNFNWWNS